MKTILKKIMAGLFLVMMMCMITMPAYAAEGSSTDNTQEVVQMTADENAQEDSSTGDKAMAAAVAIGLAAAAGAIGMGIAIAKSAEGISRQPEAEGKIRTSLMLGLVFVETAIIYALIVAILIIFVL